MKSIGRNTKIKKAFVLACRVLADYLGYPECNGETDECGDGELWKCWQRYLTQKVETEAVCRICGCTQNNACQGGCYWVKPDLCSRCAEKLESDQKNKVTQHE